MKLILPAMCLLLLASANVQADDWPQWMGANRNNVWSESGVISKFPAGGPKVVWRTPIAGGYAGPAVAAGRVYVTDYVTTDNVKVDNFDRREFSGTERVLCLDEQTGRELWKHEYPVKYSISYPAGPRCTPNVHEGLVYTLGAEGHLFCFEAKTGTVVWSRNLPRQYKAKTALWGYASHPLIDGQKLICIAGGTGSHVVALDKRTGKELWRTLTAAEQGYAPPKIIEAGGVRQLILFHPKALVSVDPETGKPYWSIPYEASSGSAIMTPVHGDNLLFVAGFSNKNLLVKLSAERPAASMVWRDQRKAAISPVNVQPFLEGGTLYGFDQNGLLYAVDLASGDRLWQSGEPLGTKRPVNSGTAFLVKNGAHFWMFNERGELLITKLSAEGYQEIDRAQVIKPTNLAFGRDVVWSPPAWANRRVYVRNDTECLCIDLAE